MSPVFVLAGLTLKEAVRRRVFIAGVVVSAIFVLWAYLPLHIRTGPLIGMDMATARDNSGKIFAWMGCGTIKFFASILAVTLAAGSLTGEVERGVLSTIVPKPLTRWQIYLGKWLGYLALLAICVAVWGALLAWAVHRQTGTFHPRIFDGILAVSLFPLLFTTLTLFFSSFANYALSAGLALIFAGVALAEDTLRRLSFILNVPLLDNIANVVKDIVPLSRMNHWITRGLGGAGIDMSAFFEMRRTGTTDVGTSAGELTYILVYIAAFMVLGLFVFQRRDL